MFVRAKKNTSGVALVAGGSGIVGYAVAKELKRQGWTVRTLAMWSDPFQLIDQLRRTPCKRFKLITLPRIEI
jgi:NAD(P)-dependent dehydrogenase (short-subunit alcohol dehydrogenase family)